jgi:GntR family transcriptional regulator
MPNVLKTYDRSRIPLYIQVASIMRNRIQSGQWRAGQKIPTLEKLEKEFEVARVTVRQAVELLSEESLLEARQGVGTFVSGQGAERHWFRLATTWSSLVSLLEENVPRRITIDKDPLPPRLEEGEGALAPKYVRIDSLQYRREKPYSIVKLHLARHIYDMNPKRFLAAAALPTIDKIKDVKLGKAHQTLVVGSADLEIADLMKVPLGAPTVECRCVVADETGTAIYVADIIYRSDSIKLEIDLLGANEPGAKKRPSTVA